MTAPIVTHVVDHTGSSDPKHFKSTLFESERLLLGVNCLEPGQSQPPHTHAGQDKAYLVMQGWGRFLVGTREIEAAQGSVIWAEAGVVHGVHNDGAERLVLVVAIAPGPSRDRG